MTKDEYFQTPWEYEDFHTRAVDAYGIEYYFHSKPAINYDGTWSRRHKVGKEYHYSSVSNFWRESLQTREEYLKLQNQPTNE